MNKISNIILLIIFFTIIYLPFIGGIIEEDQINSKIEKRTLSKLPDLPNNKKEIKNFPKDFDKYYADNFGFRDKIIEYYYDIKNRFDRNSVSPNVTFGQEGWMFLGGIKKGYTNYENPIGDAMNIDLYTKEQLKKFANSITKVQNWLKKQNIEYIFIIAPNKHTIYFDKLPTYITKQNSYSATDQLINYLKESTTIHLVDLRDSLLKQKDKQQLYYKTDTHWNYLGANIAQYVISKEIQKIFPNKITPKLLSKNSFKLQEKSGGDLAAFAKLQNIKENDYSPLFSDKCNIKRESKSKIFRSPFTTICNQEELTTLIFRDSFFTALVPYIERNFKRATYIWEKLTYKQLVKYTDLEKPDIVIEEWVERSLPALPNIDGF